MLPVKSGNNLAGIEIRERDSLDFGIAELFLDARSNTAQLRLLHTTSQDLRNLDLHLC